MVYITKSAAQNTISHGAVVMSRVTWKRIFRPCNFIVCDLYEPDRMRSLMRKVRVSQARLRCSISRTCIPRNLVSPSFSLSLSLSAASNLSINPTINHRAFRSSTRRVIRVSAKKFGESETVPSRRMCVQVALCCNLASDVRSLTNEVFVQSANRRCA